MRAGTPAEQIIADQFILKHLPYPAAELIDETSAPGYVIITWSSTEIANQFIALANAQTPPFETVIVS